MSHALMRLVYQHTGHTVRTLTDPVDGEPLVKAADVLRVLGFTSVASSAGKLIEFLRVGEERRQVHLQRAWVKTDRSSGPVGFGRPSAAGHWYLTAKGVLRLGMRSDTPEAVRFQHWLVDEVFPQVVRTGMYVPARELVVVPEVVEAHAAAHRPEALDALGRELGLVREQLTRIERLVGDQAGGARKEFGEGSRRVYRRVVEEHYGGRCPCCYEARVVEAGERVLGAEYDHCHGRHLAGLTDGWLVCGGCNDRLRSPEERQAAMPFFRAFQRWVDVDGYGARDTRQRLLFQ